MFWIIEAQANRWGKGAVHFAWGKDGYAVCETTWRRSPGHESESLEEVTCKKCLKKV